MPQDRVCGENEKAEEKRMCVFVHFQYEDRYTIKYERGEKNLTRTSFEELLVLSHNKTSLEEGQKKDRKGGEN